MSALELYASCSTPMALEPIKRPEQKLVDIFGLIRQSTITFTSPAKRRKSFRPSLTAAPVAYTCRSRENGRCSMARARPYSRKITHYASIMPNAAKHVLFPLLCRHNLRKPNTWALVCVSVFVIWRFCDSSTAQPVLMASKGMYVMPTNYPAPCLTIKQTL